jgi:hypothetical protein
MSDYKVTGSDRAIYLLEICLGHCRDVGFASVLGLFPECEPTDFGPTGESGGIWIEFGKRRYYLALVDADRDDHDGGHCK